MGQYIYSPPPPGSALTIYHYHFRDIRSQTAVKWRVCVVLTNLLLLLLYYITLLVCNVTENDFSHRHGSFRLDVQRLWNNAIQFTRWHHCAMGHGARFAVPGTTC